MCDSVCVCAHACVVNVEPGVYLLSHNSGLAAAPRGLSGRGCTTVSAHSVCVCARARARVCVRACTCVCVCRMAGVEPGLYLLACNAIYVRCGETEGASGAIQR